MNIDRWKKLREEYKEDDLDGTDAARIKRAKQTPGQESMTKGKITEKDCGCVNEEEKKTPKLNKVTRTPGGPKKFKVHVRDPSTGNIKTVRFGDPNMEIKRDDPNRRKNFRARHNCDNPGPKTKARYWSCKQWRAGTKVEGSEEESEAVHKDGHKGLTDKQKNLPPHLQKAILKKGGKKSGEKSEKDDKKEKEEKSEGAGLWDNIRKKRARIKSGSGEKMRKKGEKGAPTEDQVKKAQS